MEELNLNENLIESYENIIGIELETKENNKEIQIINNNKQNYNNVIKFEKKGKYKLIILNNNKLENLNELFYNCNQLKKIKFYKINTQNMLILWKKCFVIVNH